MSFRDPYEVVLADLRAKRDEIDVLIRSLEGFRPTQGSLPIPDRPTMEKSEAAPTPKQPESVGPLFGLSIVDASKIVMRERGRPLPVGDIVLGLKEGGHVMNSEDPSNTVSSVLNRALQQGNGVVRVGRGVWALPETMPRTVEEQAVHAVLDSGFEIPPFTTSEIDDDIPF